MIKDEEQQCVNAFVSAVKHVLTTMAFVQPANGDFYLKHENITTGDVTGIIGMTGDRKITLMLSFSEACILKIVSSMFGEEITELNDEIRDAVGELTNMISGDARRRLGEENSLKLDGGIPVVIVARNHKIESITTTPLVSIPFTVENETLAVDLAFDK